MLFSDFSQSRKSEPPGLPLSFVTDIVSFANTDGGEATIPYSEALPAICEKQKVFGGSSDPADGETSDQGQFSDRDAISFLAECLRDEIVPDITDYIRIRLDKNPEGDVFSLDVPPGPNRPYFTRQGSMTSEGVFVRRSGRAIAAGDSLIRRMLAESQEGLSFEEARSPVQDLRLERDFAGLKAAVRDITQTTVDLGELASRGRLLSCTGVYTGLGLLLSDLCPFDIVIAVYSGHQLVKRKEIYGSLISQVRLAYSYISEQIAEKEKEGKRQKYRMDRVREALVNAVVHRDYGMKGSTVISIADREIRIVSLGGPGADLGIEDVLQGAVQCRNPNLARLFQKFGLVRNCGSGMKQLVRPAGAIIRNASVTVQGTGHSFSVIIRNLDALYRRSEVEGEGESEAETDPSDMQKDMASLLQFVLKNGAVSRKDIEDEFGFGTTKSFNLLKQLCREGKIVQIRKGIRTTYAAAEKFAFDNDEETDQNGHEENGAQDAGGQVMAQETDLRDGGAEQKSGAGQNSCSKPE